LKNWEPPNSRPKSSQLARTSRKNLTCFNSDDTSPNTPEPDNQESNNDHKPKTREKSQLILVCALVGFFAFVAIERLFIKDDTLLTVVSSMLSGVIGHYFQVPTTK
jgi:hypothetical protein